MLYTLLIGLIIGAVAKFLMPGKDPGGFIITILLGIAGSFVAGFLGRGLGWYAPDEASGFMVMANLKAGMAHDALSRRDLAEKQYRKVLELREFLDSRRQAEQYLKSPFSSRN